MLTELLLSIKISLFCIQNECIQNFMDTILTCMHFSWTKRHYGVKWFHKKWMHVVAQNVFCIRNKVCYTWCPIVIWHPLNLHVYACFIASLLITPPDCLTTLSPFLPSGWANSDPQPHHLCHHSHWWVEASSHISKQEVHIMLPHICTVMHCFLTRVL